MLMLGKEVFALITLGLIFLLGSNNDAVGPLAITGLFALAIAVYFTPSFVAYSREHQQKASIFFLNLCLGWTIVGWVGALVWAYSKKPKVLAEVTSMPPQSPVEMKNTPPTKICPFCAEEVRAEAIKCKHCGSDISNVQ